jgi:orotidine-5'-phosphate decarboxylase
MNFIEKFEKRARQSNSLLCVGLDADLSQLPKRFLQEQQPQFAFNQWIIQQAAAFAAAFKANSAFYEAKGAAGIEELRLTCQFLRESYPDIPIILDAKRADIGNTNQAYLQFAFDQLQVDAITLQPYLGAEALAPFLDRKDKGCIILCKTSNPGSAELQDQRLATGEKLWQWLAKQVAQEWNQNQNCLLVVGATYPEELQQVRQIVAEMTLLVPGVGAQGADLEKTLQAGLNSQGLGLIINASRSIIFAAQPAEAAEKLRDQINHYR